MTFVTQVVDQPERLDHPTQAARPQPRLVQTNERPSGDAPAANDDDLRFLARTRRATMLNRIVEAEILPRLSLARSAAATAPADRLLDQVTTEDDAAELVRLLTAQDDRAAGDMIQRLQTNGASPAALYLGIVTQAARQLGVLWEEDRCDFSQVTISLGRLQQVVRTLSPSFQAAAVAPSAIASTVLLLPAPGEQHTLGLLILAEFFQREGWQVTGGPSTSSQNAEALVRGAMVDIIGFSTGSSKSLVPLTACIRAVRKASRNRYLAVMVGGPLFLQRPELVVQVGADTTAADAPTAVRQARGLLAMQAAAF